MKKLLLIGIMVLLLGACTGVQSKGNSKLARDNSKGHHWGKEITEVAGEFLWINEDKTNILE